MGKNLVVVLRTINTSPEEFDMRDIENSFQVS